MLTDRISIPGSSSLEVEDLFSSAIGTIFTDDLVNQHGDPGSVVVYKSVRFGNIELRLSDPEADQNRLLFSHYLWNASLQIAEFVEDGEGEYDMSDQRVLELGAGSGLAGIICSLSGASQTTITDYPAPEILSALESNVKKNVPASLEREVSVAGHCWGELDTPFACENAHKYTRVLAADCLWMPWQHANLASSISHFLSDDGKAFVVAGFHTGRRKMKGFFDADVLAKVGLEVDSIYERDADGRRREWLPERQGETEDIGQRRKWLVVAILKRK